MRAWHEWSIDEKAVFRRFHDFDIVEFSKEELIEIHELLKVQSFIRALSNKEIERINYILDCIDSGLIPKVERNELS